MRCLCLLLVVLLSHCNTDTDQHILFLSHTRLCTGEGSDKVDDRLEQLDYSEFDLLIHGGDVLCETSKDMKRFAYADSVFSFRKNLWVKGNHDDSNFENVLQFSGQKKPWALKSLGRTHFLVLDYFMKSDEFSSQEFIPVLEELQIQEGDRLVVLTHYLYWLYNHPELDGLDTQISNVRICTEYDWCLRPNDFMELIYPELLGFEHDGIEVICLAGDMGAKRRTFEYEDKNGITFLGCGVNDESPKDSVLIFSNSPEELTWQFSAVADLK